MFADLTLYWWSSRSCLARLRQLLSDGITLLKMKSFCSFQIFHATDAKNSKKLGCPKALAASMILGLVSIDRSQEKAIVSQHSLAKLQPKKRWLQSSRTGWLHKMQWGPPSIFQCFWTIKFFVFSRSLISSQLKTFSLVDSGISRVWTAAGLLEHTWTCIDRNQQKSSLFCPTQKTFYPCHRAWPCCQRTTVVLVGTPQRLLETRAGWKESSDL